MCRPSQTPPPDNVFRPDRPAEAGLGSKKRGIAPLPIHGIIGFPLSVPVLSWLFDARGRPPKEPFPVRPPAARGDPLSPRKQLEQSADSRRVRDWDPPCPALRANPFPEVTDPFCRLPLPTLFHRPEAVHLGGPDAVMSTTGRGRHSVLRIFKGRRGRTGHRATCGALPAAGPYLRLSRRALKRHPFSGLVDSAGELARQFGTVTRLPVHPASPVLLTKNGPLGALDSVARLNEAAAPSYLFKSDERFARQYRCGPPPEFPLASLPLRHSSPSFGSRQACSHSNPSQKIKVGRRCTPARGIPPISFLAPCGFTHPLTRTHVRLLGPCFKTGRMGVPHRPVPGARRYIAETARAANHDRRDGISTSLSTARALAAAPIRTGPRPESIGGPAIAVPHPTGTHRRPPFASLPTISSTL
ncbi:hypothetical protein L1887_63385 [Cichorium endivia]|nr:hypothetical protein L1887_63385 [Cichorium endivia]